MSDKKIKRIGDIIYALDTDEIFSHLKLRGTSAFQFLIPEIGFLTNYLKFDLDSNETVDKINVIRNEVIKKIPLVLQKFNFSLDLKETKLTGVLDQFIVIDLTTKDKYILEIDYMNRTHLLNPEYFARKDATFYDLHINALSTLENYAIYFVELIKNETDYKVLDEIINANKILDQQIPLIKKMITFYLGVDAIYEPKKISNHGVLLEKLTDFNEPEVLFLNNLKNYSFEPTLIFGQMMSNRILNHPKILKRMKSKA